MNLHTRHLIQSFDFRRKSTLGVALVAIFLLTPFAINNFIQDRYILGAGSLAIEVILAVNAWSIIRGRYYPLLTLLGLIPGILIILVISLREQGIVGILWCYPALLSFYFMLPERMAWLANVLLAGIILPEAWKVLDEALAIRSAATLLAVSTFSAIFVRVLNEQQHKLHSQLVIDPLTGVLNRTQLDATLEQAIQQNKRAGTPMTLLTLDLDHFKTINDVLGHDAGDKVLCEVGELLRKRIRNVDKVFRLGGEEFLAFLFGTDAENGKKLAEELRSAVEAMEVLHDHPVTVSIGVATLLPGEDQTTWMKRGDKNMYRAKLEGRNQVAA